MIFRRSQNRPLKISLTLRKGFRGLIFAMRFAWPIKPQREPRETQMIAPQRYRHYSAGAQRPGEAEWRELDGWRLLLFSR